MTKDEALIEVLGKSLAYINLKDSVNPLVKSMDNGVEKAYKEFKDSIEGVINLVEIAEEEEVDQVDISV